MNPSTIRKPLSVILAIALFLMLWSPPSASAAPDLDALGDSASEVEKIDGGSTHAVALKTDGTVWTWGSTDWGKAAHYYDGTFPRKVHFPIEATAVDVGAGYYHSAALLLDGSVWTWGWDYYGSLGTPNLPNSEDDETIIPQQVMTADLLPLNNIIAISTGDSHTLALKADGTVWAWGYNNAGQIGNGTTANAHLAVQVQIGEGSMLTNVDEIAAGRIHSMALTADNKVYIWGDGTYGQLGLGNDSSQVYAQEIPGLPEISLITTGSEADHSFAVSVTGAVYGWGENYYGQLGIGTSMNREYSPVTLDFGPSTATVSAITPGSNYTLALLDDGTLWGAGRNDSGQLGRTATYANTLNWEQLHTGLQGVSAGGTFSFLLKNNIVYGVGENYDNQLGIADESVSTTGTLTPLAALEARGYTIEGAVMHSFTDAPVEGARVTLETGYGDLSVLTDANGAYSIADVYTDTLDFIVTAPGYLPLYEPGYSFSAHAVKDLRLTPYPEHNLYFLDTDTVTGTVSGVLAWGGAYEDGSFDAYFVDAAGNKLIDGYITTGLKDTHSFTVSSLPVPMNAKGIRLFDGSDPTPAWIMLADNPGFTPEHLRIHDMDPSAWYVQPVVSWEPITKESEIAYYELLWGYYGEGIPTHEPIAVFPAGQSSYSHSLESDYISYGQDHLFLRYINAQGQTSNMYELPVPDNRTGEELDYTANPGVNGPAHVYFYDEDADPSTVGGLVTWEPIAGDPYDIMESGYTVYFTDQEGNPIQNIGYAEIGVNYFDIPSGTSIPLDSSMNPAAGIAVAGVLEDETTSHSLISETAYVPLTGSAPDVAAGLHFMDTDLSTGELRGSVTWTPAGNEAGLTGYAIAYLTHDGVPISTAPIHLIAKGEPALYEISANTALPIGAAKLALYSMSGDEFSSSDPFIYVPLSDQTLASHDQYQSHFIHLYGGDDGDWDLTDVIGFFTAHDRYDVDGMDGHTPADWQLLLQWITRITIPLLA